jgi:hypothetical protein
MNVVKSSQVLFYSLLLLLTGCAGVRVSYESLPNVQKDKPVIVLKLGEKKEVLSVGNGFPGWWGYYPGIKSIDPSIANITCENTRSYIPFREPGVIFGGQNCYIEAKKVGFVWLFKGNVLTMSHTISKTTFPSVTDETQFPSSSPPGGQWILVKVLPDTIK